MSMKVSKRLTYFDLDELKDASRLIEMKVEDAEELLTKEEGLFRKFKKLVPKVEKVTKALEDAVKSIGDLQDTVIEELSEAGGLKGQEVVASEILKIAKELMGRNWVYKWNDVKKIVADIGDGKLELAEGGKKMSTYIKAMASRMKAEEWKKKGFGDERADMSDDDVAHMKSQIDDIADEFENVDDEDNFDYVLSELYDFGDEYDIWMGM